jgi:hypothetical protein
MIEYPPTSLEMIEKLPELARQIKLKYPAKTVRHWHPSTTMAQFFDYPRIELLAHSTHSLGLYPIVLVGQITVLEVRTWWFMPDQLPSPWRDKYRELEAQMEFDRLFLGAPAL